MFFRAPFKHVDLSVCARAIRHGCASSCLRASCSCFRSLVFQLVLIRVSFYSELNENHTEQLVQGTVYHAIHANVVSACYVSYITKSYNINLNDTNVTGVHAQGAR